MSIQHKDTENCSCPMCTGQFNSDDESSSTAERLPQMAPTYNDTQVIGQIDSGRQWTGNQITYGFLQSAPYWDMGYEGDGFSAFNAYQANATRVIMSLWDDLISPSFVEQTSSQEYANVKFGNTTSGINYAHAYFPGTYAWAGEVWLNAQTYSGLYTPDPGDYYWMTILHEVGHSIGLNHPGTYNGGSPTYANDAIYAQDTHQWTVMSYFSASNTGADWNGGSGWQYAQTPMVHDIQTVQSIYGADQTTRTGDTVYGFNSTADQAVFDFSTNQSPVLTIYDAGGIDTLDLSGFSMRAIINLQPGTYSSAGGTTSTMTYNIGIAGNTWIENAIGGSGNDTIYGNALANQLSGGAGNDHLYGYDGADTLSGGSGTDWAYFSLDLSSYAFQIQQTYIQVISDVIDVVFNDIEWFSFSDTSISYGDLVNLWSLSTVESNGDWQLLSNPVQYVISDGSGTDIVIKNGGVAVGPNSYAGWSATQVEENGSGGYMVLLQHTNGNAGIWQLDANGNLLSSQSANPVDFEVEFDVDFDNDGQIGSGGGGGGGGSGTTLEANGDYELVTYNNQYFIRDASNNDVGVYTSSGTPIGPNTYSGWSVVQAEESSNGGYIILWKHTNGNYGGWELNASGASIGSFAVNPSDYEVIFDVDLDNDGQIGQGGAQVTTIESNGNYDLVTISGQYFVRDSSNNDVGLSNGGSSVGPNTYADWTAVQAEDDGGTGFSVLWKHTNGNYELREYDNTGAFQTATAVDPADYEVTFNVDLNNDGIIGPNVGGGGTVLESNGDYQLVEISGQYYIRDSSNNDIGVTHNGVAIGPHTYAGWSVVQAEESLNNGFMILWQNTNGNYGVWALDQNGASLGSSSMDIPSCEVLFEVDLDSDGQIGSGGGGGGGGSGTTLESNGDYDLVDISGQYYIRDSSNNDVGVTLNGAAIGTGTYSGWSVVQAEESSNNGFLILWQHTGGNYGVWELDQNGTSLGSFSSTMVFYETTFEVDLDSDGQVGNQPPAQNNPALFYGTAADDVFVFDDAAAHYMISGFNSDYDTVDLSAFTFAAFDDGTIYDLESAMLQDGDDVVITLDTGSITLLGTNMVSLQEDDFII